MAKKNTEEKSKLLLAIDKLEKMYGKGTVLSLDSDVDQNGYEVISTGSIGFDWVALGVGGFVKGKLYELMGWESTGKSTICAHAVAECQAKGGVAVYIDGEHAVDRLYFTNLGVNFNKLMLSQPSSGEEGFNTAMELIKTDEVDLLILDSDSSLLPKAVIDGEVGESAIGKKARLNSDAYPKLKQALVKHNVCVIVISQYREKIGVMYGSPVTTQGGNALKYYADCRIEVSRTGFEKEGNDNVANITKVKVVKNKTCSPYRVAKFNIVYGKGIDKFIEIIQLGVELNVIKKSGSWYSYEDTKLGQGIDGVTSIMLDNPELYDEIKAIVIDKVKSEGIHEDMQDMRKEE